MKTVAELKKVLTKNELPALEFGENVVMDSNDNYIVVCNNEAYVDGVSGAGAVYVLDSDGIYIRTIESPTPIANGGFGAAVALYGDKVLISNISDTTASTTSSCFLYNVDGTQLEVMTSSIGESEYGSHIAMYDTVCAVEATVNGTSGGNASNAYNTEITGDGASSDGVTLTDPNSGSDIIVSFDKVTFDQSVPAEVMYASVNGITIKFDFQIEYSNTNLDVVSGGIRYIGTFDTNANYQNPTPLTAVDSSVPDKNVIKLYHTDGTLFNTILPPEDNNGNYGENLIIQEDMILVSSTVLGTGARVYVYDLTGSLITTIVDPSGVDVYFAETVAVLNNVIYVGAVSLDNNGDSEPSRVYKYNTNGEIIGYLEIPNDYNENGYSYSLSAMDGMIAVADERDSNFIGVVYLYNENGTLIQTIKAAAESGDTDFGSKVLLTNNKLLITSLHDNELTGANKLYIYGNKIIPEVVVDDMKLGVVIMGGGARTYKI